MAESYIPEDTTVVCTHMTNGEPQMIKMINTRKVIHTDKKKPLLNIIDTKLSGSFDCKVDRKLFGGFVALCAGIALGAAIFLTGGLALGIIIAACVVGSIAGGYGLYKMAHACDATLDIKWSLSHSSVYIHKEKAILNRSILKCPKSGVVTIIMDPIIAKEAAQQISNSNMKEVRVQMASQFAIGFIAVATGGTGVGLVLGIGFAAGTYFPFESIPAHPIPSGIGTSMGTDVLTAVIGAITKNSNITGALVNKNTGNAIKGIYEMGKSAIGTTMDDAGRGILGAIRTTISHNNLKQGGRTSGYSAIGGFLASAAIGIGSDLWENNIANETEKLQDEYDKNDAKEGKGEIDVIAIKG